MRLALDYRRQSIQNSHRRGMSSRYVSHTLSARVGVGGRDRHAGAWLFVTSACFYLLCTSGHIFTPDGVIMFQVTRAIVDRGEVSIPGLEGRPGFGGTQHVRDDGSTAFYAKYG